MIYGDYLRKKYINTAVKLADAEGVPCVMEYSKGKNLRNYEIYGNSVQDGTPSPESPVEIQSVGDLTTKNLLDYTTVSARSGMTVAFIDNGFVYTGNYYFEFDGSFLEIGSTYVMSWNFEGNDTLTPTWRLAYEDGTYSRTVQNGVRLKIAKSVSKILVYPEMSNTTYTTTFTNIQLELGSTATEYEPYHKYDIPITVRGKNLLPNSDWMSGKFSNGFNEDTNVDYITEYTQNSISFNLAAWKGVSSPRFKKDSVKRIVFKINQNQINSDDGYINFYINIEGYDDENNRIGSRVACDNAVADTKYVFDFSAISISSFYANSTQFSFCIVSRKNALSNLMVYDIAYYADTDTTEYEPYIGETKHIYLNEPLRKVGDYADYIDFKNQKVVRNVKELTLDGTETWYTGKTMADTIAFYIKLNNILNLPNQYSILSDKFIIKSSGVSSIDKEFAQQSGINVYFKINKSRLNGETIDEMKAWVTANNIQLYYILAIPTEESVSFPALKTVKGTSIISVGTSVQPSNIKAKYVRL